MAELDGDQKHGRGCVEGRRGQGEGWWRDGDMFVSNVNVVAIQGGEADS